MLRRVKNLFSFCPWLWRVAGAGGGLSLRSHSHHTVVPLHRLVPRPSSSVFPFASRFQPLHRFTLPRKRFLISLRLTPFHCQNPFDRLPDLASPENLILSHFQPQSLTFPTPCAPAARVATRVLHQTQRDPRSRRLQPRCAILVPSELLQDPSRKAISQQTRCSKLQSAVARMLVARASNRRRKRSRPSMISGVVVIMVSAVPLFECWRGWQHASCDALGLAERPTRVQAASFRWHRCDLGRTLANDVTRL